MSDSLASLEARRDEIQRAMAELGDMRSSSITTTGGRCGNSGGRLKRSGMFWTVAGANAVIALRCCRLSGKFEDYWENHSAA